MAEASYIPLTEEALDDLKEYIKRCVSHAEYRSGETWEKIPIYKVETLVDGRVAIFVQIGRASCRERVCLSV